MVSPRDQPKAMRMTDVTEARQPSDVTRSEFLAVVRNSCVDRELSLAEANREIHLLQN